jgi:hypothetical protein
LGLHGLAELDEVLAVQILFLQGLPLFQVLACDSYHRDNEFLLGRILRSTDSHIALYLAHLPDFFA